MKLRRRIGSAFLALVMVISLIPTVAVSALAADQTGTENYVTVNYDTGELERTITVHVYDENGNLVDTVSITDAKVAAHTITINLTDQYKSQYDIEDVSHSSGDGTFTSKTVNRDSCSFYTTGADGSNMVVAVQPLPGI